MEILSGASIPNAGSGAGFLGLSGSGYTRGQPSIVGEAEDYAIDFSGTAYAITGNLFTLPVANVTLMAVFRVNSGVTSGTVVTPHSISSPDSPSGSRDRAMYVNSSGKLVCPIWTGATTMLVSPSNINDGLPHIAHLACGANAGAGSTLYIDGVAVASVAAISVDSAGTRYIQVGRSNYSGWPGGALATLAGRIDEVAWFNSRLSAARIQAHAQAAGLYAGP
ncbi:LamG-like jellyroll fold domain-containing protein [Ectopseudomonas khazarica]|uniref:LamG-like jellyroll fold domain-containing protein n=1 Tax=Ectopseudomonas khazarica TaxID=2502979 RepID=UPI003B9333B5